MDEKKLESWANKLLDTGKRNNLVNFKDSKRYSVEVVYPDAEEVFAKVESSALFEVFNSKYESDEGERDDSHASGEEYEQLTLMLVDNHNEDDDYEEGEIEDKRGRFIRKNTGLIKKQSQILLYNEWTNPQTVLRSIDKKARTAIEETGVNVLYMVFGFVCWKESDSSELVYRAPILLAPISITYENVISPIYIQMQEDDVVVNPTFAHILNTQFGIELPECGDESLFSYLEKIDELIKPLNWTTEKTCKIGIFSFLKLNMYEDLKKNKDSILQNVNVRTLLGERIDNDDNVTDIDEEEKPIDLVVDLHNVIDADSSQLDAILMAKKGESFVLQGPPGTGKSQTITNIIAECLSDGKKVLFVSEKQAALNVVFDKLKKAGLSEFCLELHSYKANKKDVIEELCHTLKLPHYALSERASSELEQKIAAQKELDEYEAELHIIRPVINKSLYQLYDAFFTHRNAPDVEYVISDIQTKDEQYIIKSSRLLEEYSEYLPSIGEKYTENPWYGYAKEDSSYQTTTILQQSLNNACTVFDGLCKLSEQLEKRYGFGVGSYDDAKFVNGLFSMLANSDYVTPSLMHVGTINMTAVQIEKMRLLSSEIVSLRADIDSSYDEGIYRIDGTNTFKKLARQYTNALTRPFDSGYKSIVSEILLCRKDGKKIKYNEALSVMHKLADLQTKMDGFNSLENSNSSVFGPGYDGINTDWKAFDAHCQYLKQVLEQGTGLGIIPRISDQNYQAERRNFATIADYIIKLIDGKQEDISFLTSSFDRSVVDVSGGAVKPVYHKLLGCQKSVQRLDNWCSFAKVLREITAAGLDGYVNTVTEKSLQANMIPLAYRKLFYRQWVDYIIHCGGDVLLSFNGIKHNKAARGKMILPSFGKEFFPLAVSRFFCPR